MKVCKYLHLMTLLKQDYSKFKILLKENGLKIYNNMA